MGKHTRSARKQKERCRNRLCLCVENLLIFKLTEGNLTQRPETPRLRQPLPLGGEETIRLLILVARNQDPFPIEDSDEEELDG